jgi:transposase
VRIGLFLSLKQPFPHEIYLFLAFLEIFVKIQAVSKRAKNSASFVGICPSPVESGSSIRGKGFNKKEEKPIC